ncbi:hypothetical protein [Enterococcus sp. OL5]|uniref:hypothetical protein n=1 Tax=Enterococcus sp. OL5 TaxID=2590214 RepID=UPI001CB91A81|nr:hypothetical protein [Enterococcus sp. OL5]
MILLLFTIVALVLFGTSYLLYAKQAIFFTLIPTTEANKVFLKTYSLIHFLLGVVALVVGFVDRELIALFYLALLLLSSASFSILLAQKNEKKGRLGFLFPEKSITIKVEDNRWECFLCYNNINESW